ncbi:sulfite exporter TauE/SafE family protein [uncultured Bilophila sp.]|uniref:sulfite exporter TauE/SafE family protein n=1 Tax=uncultured Bilophila sp. TaxID=529385 RepID=UPI0025CBC0E7|nr:sulfite exporter TauE/SafE family protein [uncultured Bilophila sp.]
MLMVMMAVVGFIVGFLVGCTGMGGIILIPSLVYLAGLTSHVAMGTTLFTFIFTTSLCSYLYIRLGHVDWKATIPICVGGFLFTYVGADVKAFTAAPYLNLVLALLILLAGALVFCPVKGRRFSFMEEGRRSRFWVLFAVGSGVGFVAGLTGAGGPVLSVPIMIALGFPPLIAIGAGQVYSVPVALSGTAANFLHGAIDYQVGFWMIIMQIVGILFGVYMANRMDTGRLRKLVAWVCLFCGAFILFNAVRDIIAM